MRYYNLKKDDIVKALLEGKRIILTTEYYSNHKAVFMLGSERLHGNSVRAALTELNNKEKISNTFLMPNSYDNKIYYDNERKTLLIGRR